MNIKSENPFNIKVGALFIFGGLILLEALFGPPPIENLPSWLVWSALLLVPLGYIILLFEPRIKRKKESEKLNNMYLMSYGQKIPVALNHCEVIENSATNSVLVYRHEADHQSETFKTQALPFSKTFLVSKLKGKHTVIYVDNKDRSKYFFDTDFVHE